MSIEFSKIRQEYRISMEVFLPYDIEKVFGFFSKACNLEVLTPQSLSFSIMTPEPIVMKEDSIIDYRLKLHGLPILWTTFITQWQPPHFFVDEQVKGPYRYWIHRHHFSATDNGTLVKDLVRYQVFGGSLLQQLFVKPQLERIFSFRQKMLLDNPQLFG